MCKIKVILSATSDGPGLQQAFPDIPKALIPIGNEPLLVRTLRQLNEAGLDDVTIVTGASGDALQYAALNCFPNTKFVTVSGRTESRGCCQSIREAALAEGQAVLVVESDVVFGDSAVVKLASNLKDTSFCCVCGKFSSGQSGGVIAADDLGNVLQLSYVPEYEPFFAGYWKSLGVFYIAGNHTGPCSELLHAQKTPDQYYIIPGAEHLSILPAKIFDLGCHGASSLNSFEEYDASMVRLGILKNGVKLPWMLVDVEGLKHIEQFDLGRVAWLTGKILADGVWTVPLVVDDEHGLVMDGQHRMEAALRLGLQRLPAVRLSYGEVHVYSLRPNDYSVTVEEIVERALTGNLYPYKTAKHHFKGEIAPCNIPISELY